MEVCINDTDEYIVGKEDFVIVISVFYDVVGVAGKSVRLDHLGSWRMEKLEIKFRKKKAPLGLLAV